MIAGHDRFQVPDNVVSFHIAASDGDGDPLRFPQDAPAGMRIDPSSGWVRWETSPERRADTFHGRGGRGAGGGETSARINMTIREEAAPETK